MCMKASVLDSAFDNDIDTSERSVPVPSPSLTYPQPDGPASDWPRSNALGYSDGAQQKEIREGSKYIDADGNFHLSEEMIGITAGALSNLADQSPDADIRARASLLAVGIMVASEVILKR